MSGDSLSAIVLAGGRSRRMGRDKALLEVGGKTLLARTIQVAAQIATDIVVIGRSTLPDDCPPVRVEPDQIPDLGPLAGLCQGLSLEVRPYVLCLACDFPFLHADVLRLLAARACGHDAAVPVIDGRPQPLQAIYARHVLPIAERRIQAGSFSMHGLLHDLEVCWIEEDHVRAVDPSLQSLQGANTPDEWRALIDYPGY